ncbi:hypothetical protein [Nocardia sp. NBC_01009]|nr:hypothetical protein OHA42_20340 [Nocardia sp. NBC_01009]
MIAEDPFLREGLADYTVTEIQPTRSVIAQIAT